MSSFALPIPTAQEVRRGIGYMCASVLLFSCINALVKWLTQDFPVTQIVFFRCVFALIPCSYLVMTHGGLDALRTNRMGWHATRTVIQFISLICAFTAFSMMPLADVVAISFSSPLFLTALSVPFLGERVGIHRWGAVIVGFLGVLIMVQPGPGTFQIGALFVLVNALFGALISIAVRRLSATESSTTITAYQIIFTALYGSLLLPFGWTAPDLTAFCMLAAVGLGSGIGQFWWIQSLRLAPAAVVAPFQYTAMIWSMALGYLIWSDLPGPALLGGAGIVVLSGLYILYRETVRRAPTTPVEGQD